MTLPIVPIITAAITAFQNSKVGQAPVPGFSQNVGELITSKTNMFAASPSITYGLTLLANNPHDKIGHGYFILGIALLFIRDAIAKR